MVKIFTKNFRLGKRGLERTLGELEKSIMEILWLKDGITGKEIFKRLARDRDIAITTVLTVLERLVKKGLVKKRRGENAYLYSPVCSRHEFAKSVSREVMRGVLEISASSTSASFVDILADTDPQELDRLLSLVEEKKKEISKQTT